jgi:hypothetical protein
MNNDKKHQREKKKNSNPGLFDNTLPFIIGNKNITRVAPSQLTAVANVTTFGCATSGIYIHINGPRVNAKLTIKKIRPAIIIPAAFYLS